MRKEAKEATGYVPGSETPGVRAEVRLPWEQSSPTASPQTDAGAWSPWARGWIWPCGTQEKRLTRVWSQGTTLVRKVEQGMSDTTTITESQRAGALQTVTRNTGFQWPRRGQSWFHASLRFKALGDFQHKTDTIISI